LTLSGDRKRKLSWGFFLQEMAPMGGNQAGMMVAGILGMRHGSKSGCREREAWGKGSFKKGELKKKGKKESYKIHKKRSRPL